MASSNGCTFMCTLCTPEMMLDRYHLFIYYLSNVFTYMKTKHGNGNKSILFRLLSLSIAFKVIHFSCHGPWKQSGMKEEMNGID